MKKNWIQKYVSGCVLLLIILSTGCSAQKEMQQGWKAYNAVVKKIVGGDVVAIRHDGDRRRSDIDFVFEQNVE